MNAHDTMTRYVADRAPHLAPRHRAATPAPAAVSAPRSTRRGLSAAHLVGVAVIGALIGLWISPGRAYADPVPARPGGVHVAAVSHAPAGPRITVTLSNGAVDVLRPCRFEDGRRCYWDGGTMGNGRGDSFIVTRGRVFMVPVL